VQQCHMLREALRLSSMNTSKLNKILALTKSPNQNESDAACRKLCKVLNDCGYSFSEPTDPPEPEEPFPHEHSEPPRSSSVKIKTIRNKYESYCRVCREHIPVGMKVLWSPGRGVAHIHCAEFFSQ